MRIFIFVIGIFLLFNVCLAEEAVEIDAVAQSTSANNNAGEATNNDHDDGKCGTKEATMCTSGYGDDPHADHSETPEKDEPNSEDELSYTDAELKQIEKTFTEQFGVIDTDKDRFITKEDIIKFMGDRYGGTENDHKTLDMLFEANDLDKDGKVSLEEFLEAGLAEYKIRKSKFQRKEEENENEGNAAHADDEL